MPVLKISHGDTPDVRVELTNKRIDIGRAHDNDLVLRDKTASRKHAHIVPSPEGYVLVDGGGRNGTWVRGARVGRHLLVHGDEIRLGKTLITFLDIEHEDQSTGMIIDEMSQGMTVEKPLIGKEQHFDEADQTDLSPPPRQPLPPSSTPPARSDGASEPPPQQVASPAQPVPPPLTPAPRQNAVGQQPVGTQATAFDLKIRDKSSMASQPEGESDLKIAIIAFALYALALITTGVFLILTAS